MLALQIVEAEAGRSYTQSTWPAGKAETRVFASGIGKCGCASMDGCTVTLGSHDVEATFHHG
jgi:hypothetical protein